MCVCVCDFITVTSIILFYAIKLPCQLSIQILYMNFKIDSFLFSY